MFSLDAMALGGRRERGRGEGGGRGRGRDCDDLLVPSVVRFLIDGLKQFPNMANSFPLDQQ